MSPGSNHCIFDFRDLFVIVEPIGLFSTLPTTFLSTFFGQFWVSVPEIALNSLPAVRLVLAVSDTVVKFLYFLKWESDHLPICCY